MTSKPNSTRHSAARTKGVAIAVTNPKQVLSGKAVVSPDGNSIAFAGQKNTGQEYDQAKNSIWTVDDSGVARNVESKPGQGRAPSWSPNAKELAFESKRGSIRGAYAIFTINRDGTWLIQVTNHDLDAQHPAWSADGRQLVFSAGALAFGKERRIAIIDAPLNH